MSRVYKKGEILEIEWLDATTRSGWHSKEYWEKIAKADLCKSTGYFFKSTKREISIALSTDPEQGMSEFSDMHSIPKGCIKKIRRLK